MLLLVTVWSAPAWGEEKQPAVGGEDPAKPRLVVQTGHKDIIVAVALSPDGTLALSGSTDGTLRLWDVATGREVRVLAANRGWVTAVRFSPDGRFVLSGDDHDNLSLWDVASGREIWKSAGHADPQLFNAAIVSLAFSPDGRFVVSGDDRATVRVRDIVAGKEIRSISGQDRTEVFLSPDGRLALSSNGKTALRLSDVATGKEIRRFPLEGQGSQINSAAFSPDGGFLLTGGYGNPLLLRDVSTGNMVRSFAGHTSWVYGVAFSPDGRFALSGGNDTTLRLWDVTTGKEIRSFTGHRRAVTSVCFSRDGRFALSGSFDETLRLWDVTTGKEVRTFTGNTERAGAVGFSPDGRTLFTGTGAGAFRLWDTATGKESRTFTSHGGTITSVAISRDGRFALSGSDDGALRLWNVASAKEARSFASREPWVDSVAFSPDGRFALSGGNYGTVRLWDVASGKVIRTFTSKQDLIFVIFSSDGTFEVQGDQDKAPQSGGKAAGKETRTTGGPGDRVTVPFAPYGRTAVSPDGRFLLYDRLDNALVLRDEDVGKEIRLFAGHAGGVGSVAISPDGMFVLSGGRDDTIRLWDIESGRELAQILNFTDGTWAVIDPEGRFDASGGGNVEGLHWVVNNEPIGLKQLKERYYEPGLLAKVMGFNREPLRRVDALSSVALFPEVKVSPPVAGSPLKISLVDRGGGIGRVRVLVNGKEIAADARGPRPVPNAASAELAVDIPEKLLVPGAENSVQVIAWNAEGYLSSRGEPIRFRVPLSEQPERPTLYAIVAGVSKYASPDIRLYFSGKDASDMARALAVSAGRLFGADKVNITLLTDENGAGNALAPTRDNLEKAFAAARKARSGDILVVYLAGHGVMSSGDDPDYYYLTSEARGTDLSDPAVRRVSGISSAELTEWVKRIPALKQVMVLDTCAAGGAAVKLVETRSLSSDQIRSLERLKDRTGFHILMGSAADRQSLEASPYGQGLLTYAILQGMRGAALRDDQFVDVQRLFQHAADEVPRLAGSVGGIQKPIVAAPRGTSFDIGQVTEQDKGLIPLAAVRPMILKARLVTPEEFDDPLQLSRLVNMELRSTAAHPRGGTLVYVDADELPGAFHMNGAYRIARGTITVEIFLKDGARKRKFTVTGSVQDLTALAREIVYRTKEEVWER